MREGPTSDVLAGAAGWAPLVSAWKGGTLLAAQVPIESGRLSVDSRQEVPERLTFTVPEWAPAIEGGPGRSWVPDSPDHPLAHFGQFVSVDIRVQSALQQTEWVTRLGRFVIQSWDHDDAAGLVQVECVGVLQRALDARFRTPESPRAEGTFESEFRRLVVAGVPVEVDPSLVDRPVPTSFQWPEDRLAALYDIADAWPARLRTDENGTVRLLPPLAEHPEPVLRLTDGERGTVISAPRSAGRDGIYNVVVGRSSATDDPAKAPLQAVREVLYGPLAPAEYGEAVRFWSSPLATTYDELAAAADTMLRNSVRPAISQRVTLAPDPRIELDDALELVRGRVTDIRLTTKVTQTGFGTQPFGLSPFGLGAIDRSTTESGVATRGWVVGYELPLTVHDGPMTVTVGVD